MAICLRLPLLNMNDRMNWSLLKRGYYGTYHKMSPAHLHRYVAEFEGRHNSRRLDTLEQMALRVKGADQKQLRYTDLIK